MGDDNYGATAVCVFAKRIDHYSCGSRVEVSCWLIGEEDLGVAEQCSTQRDTLGLTARNLPGFPLRWHVDSKSLQKIASSRLHTASGLPSVQGDFRDVRENCSAIIECCVLKDEAEALCTQARPRSITAAARDHTVYEYGSRGRAQHEPKQVQKRRFPPPRGTRERGHGTRHELGRQALQKRFRRCIAERHFLSL